jgi:hypothetical protein
MMKIQLFKLSWLPLIIIWFVTSCSTGTDTKAMDSLKEFYQNYIRESSKVPEDFAKIEALKAKHCTAKFLAKLADTELEADPFLNAQDVEEVWADNLVVTDATGKDEYSVCYTASFDNKKYCVKVSMVDEGGTWKINNVQ